MNILQQKLIEAFTVLVYYNMLDESKGVKVGDVPENIREAVEIKAAERLIKSAGGVVDGI